MIIDDMRQHFGWHESDTIEYLCTNIVEEANELYEAMKQDNHQDMKYELADLLMVALTLSRMLEVDLETIIKEKAAIVKQRQYD